MLRILLHECTPGIKCNAAIPCIKRVCEPVNALGLCLMPKMTQCLAIAGFSEFRSALDQEMFPWVILYIYIWGFLIMCVVLVRFTQLFNCMLKLQRALNKEFLISRKSKGAGEETWGLCLALLCLALGGCSSCENFKVVFVQDNLAGRETKLIKEKSQAVVCMELLLLILVGCKSACATIEAGSKAWMAWVAKDPQQE